VPGDAAAPVGLTRDRSAARQRRRGSPSSSRALPTSCGTLLSCRLDDVPLELLVVRLLGVVAHRGRGLLVSDTNVIAGGCRR
jgi:hypothetical protein